MALEPNESVIIWAILPENISNKLRAELWDVIAIGSCPILTVDDVERFEDNYWPIVKCSKAIWRLVECDEDVTDAKAAEELIVLESVAKRVHSGVRFTRN